MIRLYQIIHYNLGTYHKTNISVKVAGINNKIDQNKDQYYLDRQTPKISALSSGNVGNYEIFD